MPHAVRVLQSQYYQKVMAIEVEAPAGFDAVAGYGWKLSLPG